MFYKEFFFAFMSYFIGYGIWWMWDSNWWDPKKEGKAWPPINFGWKDVFLLVALTVGCAADSVIQESNNTGVPAHTHPIVEGHTHRFDQINKPIDAEELFEE